MSEPKTPDTLLTHNQPDPAGDPSAQPGPPTLDFKAPATRADASSPGIAPAVEGAGRLPDIPGYEVLGELGRGGMGVVFQARQTGLNRLVAIKMLLPGAWASAEEEARFRAEAEAIARLQHPHIVQVYQVGQVGGQHFFTLEYCSGGSLAARLKGQPLPAPIAAALVAKLADAMQAAHEAGIVHRDLKPANVLLLDPETEDTGRRRSREIGFHPKITDFGLAKQLDRDRGQTRSGAIMGTPSYMAPEQAAGQTRAIGAATDVYALGAILYELLTGRPPFRGDSLMDTLDQVRQLEPVPPRKFDPTLPADLEVVVLKCLEKSPRQRYPSALALADDLLRWQRGEGVLARRSLGRRFHRFLRRRWASVVSTLGLLLLAGFFLVGADLGLEFAGATAVRTFLDRREASRFRPAPQLAALNQVAAELREPLQQKLGKRTRTDGFLAESLKQGSSRAADVWTTAQAAAAVFLAPEAEPASRRPLLASLDRTFAEFVPGYGWQLTFPRGQVSSTPTLWVLVALAAAHGGGELIPADQRAIWRRRLQDVQSGLERYLSQNPDGSASGGWNMYANQRDPADACIYSTGLALFALLEMRRAALPWRGSPERRDELLAATMAWILHKHEGRGWRCNSLQENEFNDGLTIFLYALVQRAELEAGLPLPTSVAAAIPHYLGDLSHRPWNYPVSVGFFGSAFNDRDGKLVTDATRQVRFIWYPWSIDAAVRWLLRARSQGNVHEQVVHARRVLGPLMGALGNTANDEALSGYTYVAAETLLGLTAVQLPE